MEKTYGQVQMWREGNGGIVLANPVGGGGRAGDPLAAPGLLQGRLELGAPDDAVPVAQRRPGGGARCLSPPSTPAGRCYRPLWLRGEHPKCKETQNAGEAALSRRGCRKCPGKEYFWQTTPNQEELK